MTLKENPLPLSLVQTEVKRILIATQEDEAKRLKRHEEQIKDLAHKLDLNNLFPTVPFALYPKTGVRDAQYGEMKALEIAPGKISILLTPEGKIIRAVKGTLQLGYYAIEKFEELEGEEFVQHALAAYETISTLLL